MKVTYFQRKTEGGFSIERLFEDIRSAMPGDIEASVCINRFPSKGFSYRLYDIFRAKRKQGDINHITGDVHFLTYLLTKKKTILTIHDCEMLNRSHGLKKMLLWFFWFWLPVRRCAAITVISEYTREQLKRYVNIKIPVVVIPDCVSNLFKPFPKDFNSTCPRILQVGTKRNKNLERVVEALKGLNCRYVIIGRLSKKQIELIESHSLTYETYVGLSDDEMFSQYQQADILIFASTYEGFGLPILEANAVGRPVVTSNLSSMPEVAGNAACYINPYQVDSIRKGIEKILHNEKFRDNLIEKGFENVKRFYPETIARLYADLYRKVHHNYKK